MTLPRPVRTWDGGEEPMSRRRIAIACQGGGSQCAFVAGALDELFSHGVQDRYDIVGLSGTSGGALTAAVAWFRCSNGRRAIRRRSGSGSSRSGRI